MQNKKRVKNYFFILILLVTLTSTFILGLFSRSLYSSITLQRIQSATPSIYTEIDQWSVQISKTHELQNKGPLLELINTLLSSRNEIKKQNSTETAREQIYTATFKADMALIYYIKLFSDSEKFLIFNFKKTQPELKPYDIILSRGETLSSQLLTFRSNYSEKYSHADLLLAESDNRLVAVTVDTDGPLFRKNIDLIGNQRRLFMRPLAEIPSEVKIKTKDFFKNKDSFLKNIKFNFSLVPHCTENLFCSEFIYCFFKEFEAAGFKNPFDQSLWNTQRKSDVLFSLYQGLSPEPSDLLLNKNYEQTSEFINLMSLQNGLISDYIISVFLTKLKVDPLFRFKIINLLNQNPEKILAEIKNQKLFFINDQAYGVQLPTIEQNKISSALLLLAHKVSVLTHPAMIALLLNVSRDKTQISQSVFKFSDLTSTINQIIDEQFEF